MDRVKGLEKIGNIFDQISCFYEFVLPLQYPVSHQKLEEFQNTLPIIPKSLQGKAKYVGPRNNRHCEILSFH